LEPESSPSEEKLEVPKMKSLSFRFLMLALVSLATAVNAAHVETAEFSRVYDEVRAQVSRHGRDAVLVVFDLDNTLLANRQDLGTDQWFEWQKEAIEKKQPGAVAADIDGLIAAQSMLYALGRMRPTEPAVADTVRKMQTEGLTTIVLTARDSGTRDATLRELRANRLDFGARPVGPGFPGRYLPYRLENTVNAAFTAEEARRWNLHAPRPVSYMDGVYMVSGQHKGAMLRSLLHKTARHFEGIVFVDDKQKNNDHIAAGFVGTGVDVTTIRYTREDAEVARFNADPKQTVMRQWQALTKVLGEIF
jgi:hypothetical protein